MRFNRFHIKADVSDEDLLDVYFQQGESRALSYLYKRYVQHTYGVCRHYINNEWDAEDAVMDIFELVTKELKKKPKIRCFKDWLFIITRNFCYRRMDRSARLQELFFDWKQNNEAEFVQNPADVSLYNQKEQQLNTLIEALGELEDTQQLCLREFYLNGKSYQTIADQMGWEFKQVRTAIQNGRRNLRIRFGVQ